MNRRAVPEVSLVERFDAVAVLVLAAGLGMGVVGGAFEPSAPRWLAWVLCLLMAVGLALDARNRTTAAGKARQHFELEGPVLWIVSALALARIFSIGAPEAVALTFGTAGWLFATTPGRVRAAVLVVAAIVTLGHAFAGRISASSVLMHLSLYAAACTAFARLGSFQRWMVERAQAQARAAKEADAREKIVDFGMNTRQAEALPLRLPSVGASVAGPAVGRTMLDFVDRSIALNLDTLRCALNLQTAAVLWHKKDLSELTLRGLSASAPELVLPGPFARGLGAPAPVVRGEMRELHVAPVRVGYSGLPYYAEDVRIGSLLAVAIPHRVGSGATETDEGVDGVLCVDRASEARFTEVEREAVRSCARKISLDVDCGRMLKQVEVYSGQMSQLVAVLREFDGVLGVDPVAKATTHAIKSEFNVDLVAVCLVEGTDLLRVADADGHRADRYQGLQFTVDEGLAGRAVRENATFNRAHSRNADTANLQPVFAATDRLTELRSLLVVPIRPIRAVGSAAPTDDDQPEAAIGALVLGAHEPGLFSENLQTSLELVAAMLCAKLRLARLHEQIEELATQDGLTGLATRRVFDERIQAMVQRAERGQGRFAVIMTDIDNFKRLNDTHGHPFGDLVLKQVAQVVKRAVRKVDLAARYGGEEFVVLLDDASEEGGVQLAERIRAEIEALSCEEHGERVPVTLSLGVASYPQDGRTPEALTKAADSGLYFAKRNGKNRAVTRTQALSSGTLD